MKHCRGVQVPQVKTGNEVWFKVVACEHGRLLPCSGGKRTRYDKPVRRPDGSWSPGAWTDTKLPELCRAGYHVTNSPKVWTPDDRRFRVYWAECRGNHSESGRTKVAFASIRLLRPMEFSDLLGAPPSFWSVPLLRTLLDPKILFLYMVARGLAKTKFSRRTPQIEETRRYLLRCAAHRAVIARDMYSEAVRRLCAWGTVGSPTEIPKLLCMLQRKDLWLPTLVERHFDWRDMTKRVDSSLLVATAAEAYIDLRTFKVVPSISKGP